MVVLSAAMYATSSVELVTGKWLVPTVTFVQVLDALASLIAPMGTRACGCCHNSS